MEEHDPKSFIIDSLIRPRGARELQGPEVGRSVDGKNAKKDSIQFLKMYSLPQCQVYVVAYEDSSGLLWERVGSVEQDKFGFWHAGSGSSFRYEGSLIRKATRSYPWVYLTESGLGNLGDGWGDRFVAVGHRTDKAPDADRVRLTFKNGLTLEESFEDELLLFSTDQKVLIPVEVEVYNRSNELLGIQIAFDYEAQRGKRTR